MLLFLLPWLVILEQSCSNFLTSTAFTDQNPLFRRVHINHTSLGFHTRNLQKCRFGLVKPTEPALSISSV